jgi:hypothetical protein
MADENDKSPEKSQESKGDSSEQVSSSKKKSVAKDIVQLTHVDVKKREISKETVELADIIKQKGLDQNQIEDLTNDEITILESFENKRLFLSRIAIIANQSRIPLGIQPFMKEDLEKLLDRLIHREYLDFEIVNKERVYFLTEKGKQRLQ